MSTLALAWLLGQVAPLATGPAYVKVASLTARSCPAVSCLSAGDVKAGDAYRIQELRDGWARVMAPNGSLTAWVPADGLASGRPVLHRAARDVDVLPCLEPGCRRVATIRAGSEVPLLEVRGGAASVLFQGSFGWVRDARDLESTMLPPPAPAYVAPAEAPAYIPPSEAPRYIPSDSTAVYVPPVPAPDGAVAAGERFVREPTVDLHEGPSAASRVLRQAPGGARVTVQESKGDWTRVHLGETDAWVPTGALGKAAPRLRTLGASLPGSRACPDAARCEPEGPAIPAGSQVVVIDEAGGGAWMLAVLPGTRRGWGWLPSSSAASAP